MILYSAPASPFGRKVELAADILGLSDAIEVRTTDTNDSRDPNRAHNPTGKIPTLVLEDGAAVFDSRVILDYLDARAGGGKIIPSEPRARVTVLTRAALADGALDACILLIYEKRWREADKHEPKWLAYQAEKVERTVAAFAADPPTGAIDVAHIGLAALLGYRDLRFGGDWRIAHPGLVGWLDAFSARVPAFARTTMAA